MLCSGPVSLDLLGCGRAFRRVVEAQREAEHALGTNIDTAPTIGAVAVEDHRPDPTSGPLERRRDDLRFRNLLPATDPYLATTTAAASVFDVTGLRAPVDWVLIELRPADDPAASVEQIPALLLSDGSVVDVDGFSPVRASVATGEYFLTINHRNHLPATILLELGPRGHLNIDLGVSEASGIEGGGGVARPVHTISKGVY